MGMQSAQQLRRACTQPAVSGNLIGHPTLCRSGHQHGQVKAPALAISTAQGRVASTIKDRAPGQGTVHTLPRSGPKTATASTAQGGTRSRLGWPSLATNCASGHIPPPMHTAHAPVPANRGLCTVPCGQCSVSI